jgi:hypothetical protein
MANQFERTSGRTRLGSWAMASVLLTTVGCGFPHDRYASDAMLGQFNRPIAPTPPIWTGGDPGVSPAYDGGARIGLPSPDVPAQSNPILDRMFIMPTFGGSLGVSNLYRGNSGATSTAGASGVSGGSQRVNNADTTPNYSRQVSSTGAQFMSTAPAIERNTFVPGMIASANSVKPRTIDTNTILTSGAAIEPSVTIPKPLTPLAGMKDPRSVISVEEGQMILQTCGARSMTMESQPTGEWRFICTINEGGDNRRYEAQSGDQIEAVRAVMWQVKNER